MTIADQPTPTYKVIAFDAKNAGIIPTRVILASHSTSGDARRKEAKQHTGAIPAGNPVKTIMAAPAANASLRTIVIPGYSGPA